jgi:hypothetical protein
VLGDNGGKNRFVGLHIYIYLELHDDLVGSELFFPIVQTAQTTACICVCRMSHAFYTMRNWSNHSSSVAAVSKWNGLSLIIMHTVAHTPRAAWHIGVPIYLAGHAPKPIFLHAAVRIYASVNRSTYTH